MDLICNRLCFWWGGNFPESQGLGEMQERKRKACTLFPCFALFHPVTLFSASP